MAPSARIQLSSNSRWVVVVLDWEDTKVKKDTQKTAEKLMKGIVSSVRHWTFPPDLTAGPEPESDWRSWQSPGSGNWHTKDKPFWRGFEWVGLSVAFCQLETQVQIQVPVQASWACLLVSVTQPYVEPRVGDTSPSSSTSGPVELRSTGYLVQWQGINLLLGVSPAKASSYYTRLSCAGG